MKNTIQLLAEKHINHVMEIREHIHMNPELSFEEYETSAYVKSKLTLLGIEYTEGWVNTGIVGIIKGGKPGKVRALRSELDALPIHELSDVPYRSKVHNKMHACGHDVHTACLLGAAMILQEIKDEIEGTILLVFQPGEELLPGGASLMLKEGLVEQLKPEYIIAQHVFPELEAGKVGICPGQYMASSDELYFAIKGKGGHGALPHSTVDTILMTSHIITALQSIVSRYSNPITPSVLTIGKINSIGGATNIIPDEVKLEGTFRTLDENWRKQAHENIIRITKEIARSFGGDAEVEIRHGYPSLYNDPSLTEASKLKLQELLSMECVIDLPKRMTSEDFSYYSQVMPACFYRLGVKNEANGLVHGIHTPYFDAGESSMKVGMMTMAFLAATLN
jgi:amidohydrolase